MTESSAPKNDDKIVVSKDAVYMTAVAVLFILLVASIFSGGFGIVKTQVTPTPTNTGGNAGSNTGTGNTNTGNTNTGTNTAVKTFALPKTLNDAPVQGTTNNGIAVLEFSDFQCPYCGMAWGTSWAENYKAQYGPIIGTVKNLETEYVKTGKVNFVQFPVAFLGQESIDASNAALCAKEQGKFWEMHDAIFAAQTPEENNGKYSKDKLKAMGASITGIDTAKFNACVDGNTYVTKVNEITSDASSASQSNTGQFGTPTFYIVVDAKKMSFDKVSSAASLAGYTAGQTSDKTQYVIIADPTYSKLKKALDALLA